MHLSSFSYRSLEFCLLSAKIISGSSTNYPHWVFLGGRRRREFRQKEHKTYCLQGVFLAALECHVAEIQNLYYTLVYIPFYSFFNPGRSHVWCNVKYIHLPVWLDIFTVVGGILEPHFVLHSLSISGLIWDLWSFNFISLIFFLFFEAEEYTHKLFIILSNVFHIAFL